MSSESILDEIEFTWKIANFSMHWQFRGETIRSPLISVGNPRHSIWVLELYPQGMGRHSDNMLITELVRLEGSMKGKMVSKIFLVTSKGNTLESSINTKVRSFLFERLVSYDGTPLQDKKDLELYLPNDILTLQCKLTLFGDPHECAPDPKFSEDFGRLLESGDCSDLVLCSGDREFLVHRAILGQSSPKLFKELRLSDDPNAQRVEVSTISTPVLEVLLAYLYTGKVSPFFNKSNLGMSMDVQRYRELIEVATRFDLVELTGEVISLSPPTTIFTHIKSICRNVKWVVKRDQAMEGVSNIINFGPSQVLARFQLRENPTGQHWTYPYYADVTFRCLSAMDKDEHFSCRMTIKAGKEKRSLGGEHHIHFSEANPEHCMPKREFSLEPGDVTLKLFLKIADGKETHSVDGVSPEVSAFGTGFLRHHLTSLFEENLAKNGGDVTLICNEQTLRADRAVLSARSPVFSGMFSHDMTEKNSDRVDILDVDYATALRLVRFMYSEMVSKQSFEEDAKLYSAADKYQVTSLFRKCSVFMESHLILNNACDILTMAFMHNDDSLMATVKDYVCINLEAIEETSEWQLLCDTNPCLATLVKESICIL